MATPVSFGLTDFDVDLLDFLTSKLSSPNRSHTVHLALVALAKPHVAADRLVRLAVQERAWIMPRRRTRGGRTAKSAD